MVPTMIVFGLVAGYWWRPALPAAAIAWPALLVAAGVISIAQVPGAALVGVANAAVGVAAIQAGLFVARTVERRQVPGQRR